MDTRTCWKCETPKPIDQFGWTTGARTHRRRVCKACKELPGRKDARPHTYRKDLIPLGHPTVIDIAWAAGIYEGEGNSGLNSHTSRVCVTQKDRWLLDRLRFFFGGSIQRYKSSYTYKEGTYFLHRWTVQGVRARGFLWTVYTFLSPRRREQANRTLGVAA